MLVSNPHSCLEPVDPVKPLAPYIGGKRQLAKRLIALINSIEHTTYAEVFVGMGGVFLRRDRRPKGEVINDLSEDVSTFFRVVQHHYIAFLDMLRFQITSRAGFEKLLAQEPDSLTDLQRSARFLYLQRLAFGGKVQGQNFGVVVGAPARFDVTKLAPLIEAVHERLAPVVIERLPWGDFIRRYDRPGTLFYLDPPYYGSEGDYGRDLFDRGQFELMAEQLRAISGRFVLSLNDHPEVRRIFAGFHFREERLSYSLAGNDKAPPVRLAGSPRLVCDDVPRVARPRPPSPILSMGRPTAGDVKPRLHARATAEHHRRLAVQIDGASGSVVLAPPLRQCLQVECDRPTACSSGHQR
jgi:DNA adenine methylase